MSVPIRLYRGNAMFMQDGSSPYSALSVRDFLGHAFGKSFDNMWPSNSPDLSPFILFLT